MTGDRSQAIDRIMANVVPEPNSGCWLWHGACNGHGYGHVQIARKVVPVHRVVYEHFRDEIPKGLHVDHLCRVKVCCNPDHLEPVTHTENMRRGHQWRKENGVRIVRRKKRPCKLSTHCANGHLYTDETSIWRKTGGRSCRVCHRISQRRINKRNAELRGPAQKRTRPTKRDRLLAIAQRLGWGDPWSYEITESSPGREVALCGAQKPQSI